jgi:hypothetical protein
VDWAVDPAPQRRASRLLVTLHGAGGELLSSHAVPISGSDGTAAVPVEPATEMVRASAYNALRQRSDPLETAVATQEGDRPDG